MSKKIIYKKVSQGYQIGIYERLTQKEDMSTLIPEELGAAYTVYNPKIKELDIESEEGSIIVCGESSESPTYIIGSGADINNKNVFIHSRRKFVYANNIVGLRYYDDANNLLILEGNKISKPLKVNFVNDPYIPYSLPGEFCKKNTVYISNTENPEGISFDIKFKLKTTNRVWTFTSIVINRGYISLVSEERSYSVRHGLSYLELEEMENDIATVLHNPNSDMISRFFTYNHKEKYITFTMKNWKLLINE